MDVMMQKEDLCRRLFRTSSTIRSVIYPPRTQKSPCGGELLMKGHVQSLRKLAAEILASFMLRRVWGGGGEVRPGRLITLGGSSPPGLSVG